MDGGGQTRISLCATGWEGALNPSVCGLGPTGEQVNSLGPILSSYRGRQG